MNYYIITTSAQNCMNSLVLIMLIEL